MSMTSATHVHRPEIEYPDSDGKPMSDHDLQFKWIVVIKEGVGALFIHDPNVYVAGNLLWYPVEGNNKIRQGPDILVAFGRPKRLRGSYKQWEEGGIAPQVIFEVLSPGNRSGEMKRKFEFYQRYEVEEYYVYNPHNGTLRGWLRVGQSLVENPVMAGFVSPRLGIRFEPGQGPDSLTIIRPDGERFLTYEEILEERNAERLHAQAERQHAQEAQRHAEEAEHRAEEAERHRAEAARRAERYAALLREMGVEPD